MASPFPNAITPVLADDATAMNPIWFQYFQTNKKTSQPFISVLEFGAIGDGIYIAATVSITSGTAALTATGASFTARDIGKAIVVPGAGAAGASLATTISAFTSSTQVTLAANAGTTLTTSAQTILYGTDNAGAINNALTALPVHGGDVIVPPGIYVVTSTINLGNGTTTAVSTRIGMRLIGQGHAVFSESMFTGYPTKQPTVIIAATTSVPVIQVNGPVQGWGIENVAIDAQSISQYGIKILSGQYGNVANIAVTNARIGGIYLAPIIGTLAGVSNLDVLHNEFRNVTVTIPNIAAAAGIVLTSAFTSTNSDYNLFLNTTTVGGGSGVSGYGIYLGASDSNVFIDTHFFNGGTSFVCVAFDYTVNNVWPASNAFYHIDPGPPSATTLFQNISTPHLTAARPNLIYGLLEGNGATWPTTIANLIGDIPNPQLTKALTGQTASIGASALFTPWATGTYRVSYYLSITTSSASAATVAASLFWQDESTAVQSFSTPAIGANATNYTSGAITIRATSLGTQFTTTVTGAILTSQYQLHWAVERLSN